MHVYICVCIGHKYKSKSVHSPNTKSLRVEDGEFLISATAHSSLWDGWLSLITSVLALCRFAR